MVRRPRVVASHSRSGPARIASASAHLFARPVSETLNWPRPVMIASTGNTARDRGRHLSVMPGNGAGLPPTCLGPASWPPPGRLGPGVPPEAPHPACGQVAAVSGHGSARCARYPGVGGPVMLRRVFRPTPCPALPDVQGARRPLETISSTGEAVMTYEVHVTGRLEPTTFDCFSRADAYRRQVLTTGRFAWVS